MGRRVRTGQVVTVRAGVERDAAYCGSVRAATFPLLAATVAVVAGCSAGNGSKTAPDGAPTGSESSVQARPVRLSIRPRKGRVDVRPDRGITVRAAGGPSTD